MNGKALHLIAEAEKLAFADRDHYIADPDFVPAPMGLLDADYLGRRRALDQPGGRHGQCAARARRPRSAAEPPGDDETVEQPGTSHFSIVDRDGNVLSMTTTIESAFGSRAVGRGLPAEQRAHRLRLPPHRWRRPAVGQRGRAGQAPAQLDGADHRLRCAGQALGRVGIARGQPHHSLCRQGAGGADRLEARRARPPSIS